VTTPPQPTPAGEKPLGHFLRPLRDLAVYALIGLPAVLLFVSVIDLFGTDFVGRTRYSFGSFVNLVTIFFPLAAVLLALGVQPAHPKSRLIVLAGLVEYGVVAFFGLVFGVLFGISGIASDDPGAAFTELLVRGAWLAVFGLAAWALVQIWRGLFTVPKQPGVYGQPQYGQPQQYGQPPFGQQPQQYGQPYGQQPPPGQPPFAQQPPFGAPQPGYGQQPGYPAPAPTAPTAPVYGQPAPQPPAQPGAQPSWNQPAVPTPPLPGQAPTSAVPASGAPVPAAPFTDPTQVVPKTEDRTEKIPDDRPGFGPAGQDPPRQ
jgi:hypothetical protein